VTHEDTENPSHEIGSRALYPRMFALRDQDALSLLRRRDERGFDLAYERYADRLFGFLVRLSRSRALAEDLLQHTFLRLAESGPLLRPDSDLRAWLFTVARNAYQSHARSLGVEARLDPVLAGAPSEGASVGALSPESGLAMQELESALGRLSVADRELLLLIGVEGLSYAEMAVVLNSDAVAIRKRVSRARARLAQMLDEPLRFVRNSELKP
jgi:RNA polymerase sigma-70 factor (ECF subfamily)